MNFKIKKIVFDRCEANTETGDNVDYFNVNVTCCNETDVIEPKLGKLIQKISDKFFAFESKYFEFSNDDVVEIINSFEDYFIKPCVLSSSGGWTERDGIKILNGLINKLPPNSEVRSYFIWLLNLILGKVVEFKGLQNN